MSVQSLVAAYKPAQGTDRHSDDEHPKLSRSVEAVGAQEVTLGTRLGDSRRQPSKYAGNQKHQFQMGSGANFIIARVRCARRS